MANEPATITERLNTTSSDNDDIWLRDEDYDMIVIRSKDVISLRDWLTAYIEEKGL